LGARFFTVIDLASGYWQVKLDPTSREKTAFATHRGQYQFNVLPFGACNAPFWFQTHLSRVLSRLRNVRLFIDDILIASQNFAEHLADISAVFARLAKFGLFCQPKKCYFARSELLHLGHRVSAKGLAVDPRKTTALAHLAETKDVAQLQSFLGIANYYNPFVPDFADVAAPLYELLKDGVEWHWGLPQRKAFALLKLRLVTAPVLQFPDFARTFILQVDASEVAIGGVLSQKNAAGEEHPVLYVSHKLTTGERKWHIREKEAFAIVWCCVRLRYYLVGKPFVIETDHKGIAGLRWVLNHDKPGRLTRWALLLQEFSFTIHEKPGKDNANADALSRLPVVASVTISPDQPVELPSQARLLEMQLNDPLYSRVMRALQSSSTPNGNDASNADVHADLSDVKSSGGTYQLAPITGLLVCVSPQRPEQRIVLPPKLRYTIFTHYHRLAAHARRQKTYALIAKGFYWFGMWKDIAAMVVQCWECQKAKAPLKDRFGELVLFPCSEPLEIMATDILGGLGTSAQGNKYVLVVCDKFTRWADFLPMKNMLAETVADALCDHVFYKIGLPKKLLSDRGAQFTSRLMRRLCTRFDVNKIYTSAYHPQSDGQCERLNRFIISCLRVYTEQHGNSDWDKFLPAIGFAYRATVTAALGTSPFFLMFARHPTLPTDVIYGAPNEIARDQRDYAMCATRKMRIAFQLARDHQEKYQTRMKENYDRHQIDFEYEIGDLVWLHTPRTKTGLKRKLGHRNSGPYPVIAKHSPVSYTIRVGNEEDENMRVHIHRMIPYYQSPERDLPPLPQVEHDDGAPGEGPQKPKIAKSAKPKSAKAKRKAKKSKKVSKPAVVCESDGDTSSDNEDSDLEIETLDVAGSPDGASESAEVISDPCILNKLVSETGKVTYRVRMGGSRLVLPAEQVPRDLIRLYESQTRRSRQKDRTQA